jgi:hypothetical protein
MSTYLMASSLLPSHRRNPTLGVIWTAASLAIIPNLFASNPVLKLPPTIIQERTDLAPGLLSFEPNHGQEASPVRYIAQGAGYKVRLETARARIELAPHHSEITLNFGSEAEPAGTSKLDATKSYFLQTNPNSWIANVPTYAGVTYRDLYPDIDLAFHANQDRLEYDFVLRPGADPKLVRFTLSGMHRLHLDSQGNLASELESGTFKLLKPVAWQPATPTQQKTAVDASYRISQSVGGLPKITFVIGAYDHRRPLVIDPVLAYGLYIPGPAGFSAASTGLYSGSTTIRSMTADALGNTYIAAQIAGSGSACNILKFDPNGNLLLNVSIGSSDIQATVAAIAVDASSNIYIAGTANTGLVTTANAFQPSTAASAAPIAFLTKIKSDASTLLYSTYLGGAEPVQIGGLAVDQNGNAYLDGTSSGTDFPATPGTYAIDPIQSSAPFLFVAKIGTLLSGSASLLYSALLNSNFVVNAQTAAGIALDPSGDAYFVSNSPPGLPTTQGAYQFLGLEAGDSGTYVTELNPTATSPVYTAFLGPGTGAAIAVDSLGNAYVAGTVNSAEFPVIPNSYQTSYAGGFAAKLGPGGSQLLYSTFLSGPTGYTGANVQPQAIAIPGNCLSYCPAFIAGITSTTDFPLTMAIQSALGTKTVPTGFITELAGNASFALFSTYLGAIQSPTTVVAGLSVDAAGNIYFASNIAGPDAPITQPSGPLPGNGYLAKISPANTALALATPATLDFGSSLPIGLATTYPVEFRNLSTVAISPVFPFTFSSSEFTETDDCPVILPSGTSCQINVSITQAASGLRTGTLNIASSAPNSPATVGLTGIAANEPALGASTYVLNFPDTIQAYASATQSIALTNYGDTPVDIAPETAGLPDFVIADGCPAQLAPQSTCNISVTFAPTKIGLLSESIFIQEPGQVYIDNNGSAYTYANGLTITLNGTGTLGPSGSGNAVLSATALNFGNAVFANPTALQYVALTNQGNAPLTIESASIAGSGESGVGDFQLLQPGCAQYSCAASLVQPIELEPQQAAVFGVGFTPSLAGLETGVVTFTDSGPGGPQTVALAGIGVVTQPSLSISPSSMAFPVQPLGDASAPRVFAFTNTGGGSILIDRVITAGDFAIDPHGSNCEAATLTGGATCNLAVSFIPTATGVRLGVLRLIDSLGNTQTFSLGGTGILSTGTITVSQPSLAFPGQSSGTTSPAQQLTLANPGNVPVTINTMTTTGDFAITSGPQSCSVPGSLAPYSICNIDLAFTPTLVSGAETGSLMIKSSAGTQIVTLAGISLAADSVVELTPSTVGFSTVKIGATAGEDNYFKNYNLIIQNLGNQPVTLNGVPGIVGVGSTPSRDFTLNPNANNCYQYIPNGASAPSPLLPGQSCTLGIAFTPSLIGPETATFTLTDSAGTQSATLTGTGASTVPPVVLSPATYVFGPQTVNASSAGNYGYDPLLVENHGTSPIIIASVVITAGGADFSLSSSEGSCAIVISANSNCSLFPVFSPSGIGYRTGTLTVKDTQGNIYTASLAGYGVAISDSAGFSPPSLNFQSLAVGDAPDATEQTLFLVNTGNTPLAVGRLTSVNVVLGATNVGNFSASDECSEANLDPGAVCYITVYFRPLTVGEMPASITAPVTYADGNTAILTARVSGAAIPVITTATLLPAVAAFGSTTIGQTSPDSWTFTATNTGDETLFLGTPSSRNLSPYPGFSGPPTTDFVGNIGSCAGNFAPGQTCSFTISFAPIALGTRTGSITIPGSFANGRTGTLYAAFSGTAIAATQIVQINPMSSLFNAEVAGTLDINNELTYSVVNAGTGPVIMNSATTTPNFTVTSDTCSGKTIPAAPPNAMPGNRNACQIVVAFTPLASATAGFLQGTLTIADNAAGPQTVSLAGYALSTAQALTLSQSTVSFATLPVDTSSASQVVYLVDRAPYNNGTGTLPRIQIDSIQLGGINPSDFEETENCGGSLGFTLAGRTVCSFTILFAPNAGTLGPRSATVTITPAVGPPLTIQLTGNAATPEQVASITPASLSFAPQTVNSASSSQAMQIKNITSRAISLGRIVSTNASEFSITRDPCSGSSVAPKNTCVISVAFTPESAGGRTGLLQINSTAGEFLRGAAVSGTGVTPAN